MHTHARTHILICVHRYTCTPCAFQCYNWSCRLPLYLTDCRVVMLQNAVQSMLRQSCTQSNDGTGPPPTGDKPVGNVNLFGEDGESINI